MLLGLIIKIFGTFADLGLPWVLAYILDEVIPYKKISYILLWGVLMLILAIAARQLNITANRMASKVARDSVQRIRHDAFEKICHLSGAQVDMLTVPSLISRMTTDTYNLHQVIGMMQRLGVRVPIILVGGIVLTSTLDLVLTLVLIATLPLLALVIYMVSKVGIPIYTKMQQRVDSMVRTIRENIIGIRVIKALSKTEYEKDRFRKVSEEVSDYELKAGSVMALSGPLMNLLLNVGLAFIIVVGAYRVDGGQMLPGKIVAFLSYFTMILIAMMMVNRLFVGFSKGSASAKRMEELLLQEEDLKVDTGKNDTSEKVSASEESLTKDNIPFIKFNQVSFGYSGSNEKRVLKSVSFSVQKGDNLGIIGSTGSGKTTIVNLLMRFYDTKEGTIYIAGRDIRSYSLRELRNMYGTVFQNDMIFADTIAENISFGRNLDNDQIELAAKYACANEFIEHKEGAYEFEAAIKGANLSGGQKQRILIARALANHPQILVLDDSSSALDYKTDASLRKAIREKFKDTTLITIAQRISSVMHMDRILVLEEGEVIGYGTHDELLATCEVYQEIYESQMGGIKK
jgi:ATP-binding cassette subfamily B protein